MNLRRVLRPRLLGMVVVMLALLGVASYLTMARQEDPSFPYRAGLITVIYPGAVAESVERLVLEPLSDELSKLPFWYWHPTSSSEESTIDGACELVLLMLGMRPS